MGATRNSNGIQCEVTMKIIITIVIHVDNMCFYATNDQMNFNIVVSEQETSCPGPGFQNN